MDTELDNIDNSEVKEEEMDEDEDNTEMEDQIEDQDEKEPEENPLNEKILQNCISMLCKTSDGLNFAFVQLYCINKLLTDVALLENYTHLRYINLAHNELRDVSQLSTLNDLILLDCSYNRIDTMPNFSLPYLRNLNLSNNRIKKLSKIKFDELELLNLNANRLMDLNNENDEAALTTEDLPNLTTIELRGNQLTTTSGLQKLDGIRSVYMAKNKIEEIKDLENLTNLSSLHLRENNLNNLDGFPDQLQALQYLNIRDNQIETMNEIRKLKHLSLLRAVVLSGNPVSESDEYRLESLIALRKLIRLDKDSFLDEERSEAEKIYEQRLTDEMLENQETTYGDNSITEE